MTPLPRVATGLLVLAVAALQLAGPLLRWADR